MNALSTPSHQNPSAPDWQAYAIPALASVCLVAATAVLSFFVQRLSTGVATAPTLTLLFLLPIAISAHRFGLGAAVLTLTLSVLCWIYLYAEPAYDWAIDDPRDILALEAFVAVSLLIGGLALAHRRQTERLAKQARSLSDQCTASQRLLRLATIDAMVSFILSYFAENFGQRAIVILEQPGEPVPRRAYLEKSDFSQQELIAIDAFLVKSLPQQSRDTQRVDRFTLFSLDGHRGRVGVVAIDLPAPAMVSEERYQAIRALLSHAAIAMERARLARAIESESAPGSHLA